MPKRRSRRSGVTRAMIIRSRGSGRGSRTDWDNFSVQDFLSGSDQGDQITVVGGSNNHVVINQGDDTDDDSVEEVDPMAGFFGGMASAGRVDISLGGGRVFSLGGGREDRRAGSAPYAMPRPRVDPPVYFVPPIGPRFLTSTGGVAPMREVPMTELKMPGHRISIGPRCSHVDHTVYTVHHSSGTDRKVGVVGTSGKKIIGLLTELYDRGVAFGPQSVCTTWDLVLMDPRFTAASGPLMARKKTEILFCAALICYGVARAPYLGSLGSAALPAHRHQSCASLLNMPVGGADGFDRATVMATSIVNHYNFTAPELMLTVDGIMDYNLYKPFQERILKDLQTFGIVSHKSDMVGTHVDLKGVALPLFLFLDAIFCDCDFRGNCPLALINVTDAERNLIENNARIHSLTWT